MKKILIMTNSICGLYSFRAELVSALIDDGFEVSISAPLESESNAQYFNNKGCTLFETEINRRSVNPVSDLLLLVNYIKLLRKLKPDTVLTYTIKPNIYGGMACRFFNIPLITNITGLGTAIENQGLLSKILLSMYRVSLKKAIKIFFQNHTNASFFQVHGISNKRTTVLVPGSGVNISKHNFEDYPKEQDGQKFLYLGRLMAAKGCYELFEAAKRVKALYPETEFHIIGGIEDDFKDKEDELTKGKHIIYHGTQKDVHGYIKKANAVINPSYHEGMSNVLLEAASTGRPVLASRIPGCVETFDEGSSGYGFNAKDVDSMTETILRFIKLPYEQKRNMGIQGRKKMEQEFDRMLVVDKYLEEVNKSIGGK